MLKGYKSIRKRVIPGPDLLNQLPDECANRNDWKFRRLASRFLFTVYRNGTQINRLQVFRLQAEYLKGTTETCWPSREQMSLWDHSWVNMHKQHLVRNYPQTQGDGNKQALIFTTVGKKGSSMSRLTSARTAEATCEPTPPPRFTMMFLCSSSRTKKTQTLCNHVEIRGGGINKARQRRF